MPFQIFFANPFFNEFVLGCVLTTDIVLVHPFFSFFMQKFSEITKHKACCSYISEYNVTQGNNKKVAG